MGFVPSYVYRIVLMGSPIALKLYQRCDETAKQAFALIRDWETRLTVNAAPGGRRAEFARRGAPAAELMAVNAAAGKAPVRVSADIFALLERAQAVSLAPQSCFNFAVGPVVKAWNIGFAAARRPSAAELARALSLTDARQVQLNRADCSVFLPRCGMALDLGAIAKGFIADCVKDYLARRGAAAALINLGGNVAALGAPLASAAGQKQFWAVGLQKPFAPRGALLGLLHIADQSVVSSGIYERYFLPGSRAPSAAEAEAVALRAGSANAAFPHKSAEQKGGEASFCHHIFNPQTGLPLHNDLISVSVIAEKSTDGEIWSSLLYGMGSAAGTALLSAAAGQEKKRAAAESRRSEQNEMAAVQFSANLPLPRGLTAVFVTKDRRILLPAAAELRFAPLNSGYRVGCYP